MIIINRPNKHKRNAIHKAKLWKLIDKDYGDGYHVWGNCRMDEEPRYPKRYYRGKRSPYLKKLSNKKIRRYKGDFSPKGNGFHKVFDFWWELD